MCKCLASLGEHYSSLSRKTDPPIVQITADLQLYSTFSTLKSTVHQLLTDKTENIQVLFPV